MSNKHDQKAKNTDPKPMPEDVEIADVAENEPDNISAEEMNGVMSETESLKQLLNDTQEQLEKEKKEYLFLMAEFDNFRKRTLREKSEIIKNGAEGAMKGLLPIIDDFERGLQAINGSSDVEAVKEGMELIYNKFIKYLEQNGVKEIPTQDQPFDTDRHEAIAMVPTDDPDKKGKVIDTIAKGYTLNDKVIRHAKVAVAQ
ncbi:MAG: nucleotide exchange factor GrpE [Bacteroidales bacterium]|nr:nucleotide exchange factor GrpE [Bacteroidales bacterium]MCD8393861.1 nucleotide exchange factor GrpE [Bacteroidales bacterium]